MSILFLSAAISGRGPAPAIIILPGGHACASFRGAPPHGRFLLYQEDAKDNKVLYKISAS